MTKISKMSAPKMRAPMAVKVSMPHASIHPSAAHVGLPRGLVNTQKADPAPSLPGVGRV